VNLSEVLNLDEHGVTGLYDVLARFSHTIYVFLVDFVTVIALDEILKLYCRQLIADAILQDVKELPSTVELELATDQELHCVLYGNFLIFMHQTVEVAFLSLFRIQCA
jgi:hypothetical protein